MRADGELVVPRRLFTGLMVSAVAVEAMLTAWSVLVGLYKGRPELHWEEIYNAEVASYALSGHWADLLDVQYRTFCGGCSVEAAMAAPLFLLFGRAIGVWKLVPLFFHLLTMSLCIVLARRTSGRMAAAVVAALFLAAPPYYRLVAEVGWGNHVESAVFTLGALLLVWCALRDVGTPVRRPWAWLGMAGLVAGFGFYFCYTSGHAFPAIAAVLVLGLLARRLSRRGAVVFPAAFALGFSPWVLYRLAIDMPLRFEQTSMAGEQAFPQGPGPVAAARFLVHDSFVLGVWRGRDHILPAIVSYSWLLLVVVLVFVAAWMGLRSLRGLHRLRNRRAGWALVGPLLTLGLVVGMSARPATFRALPDEEPLLFYHLRYFTPLFVAAVLSMGAVIGSLFQGNRGRRGLAVVLLGLLVAPGVYLRCAELGPVSLQSLGILVQPSLRREDPPIRGRSPEQAAGYLETHPDRFPEVRSHHFARAGRHLVRDHDAGLEELWSVALTDRDRRALCDGVVCQLAPGWRLPDPLPDQATLFLEAAPAAIRGELLVAAGRWGARGHGAGVPPGPAWYKGWSVLEGLRDEVLRGACEVAGYRTGAYLFHPGTSPERRDELRAGFVGLLAQCGESVLFDAGRAMTLHGGCSRESLTAALPAELDKPSLWEGVDWACAYERVF